MRICGVPNSVLATNTRQIILYRIIWLIVNNDTLILVIVILVLQTKSNPIFNKKDYFFNIFDSN